MLEKGGGGSFLGVPMKRTVLPSSWCLRAFGRLGPQRAWV